MAKKGAVSEDPTTNFLNDLAALEVAREQARKTFVELRFAVLFEEFELFAGPEVTGFGPWLLQQRFGGALQGVVHPWAKYSDEDHPGFSGPEAIRWAYLFDRRLGDAHSRPGMTHFIEMFNTVLEQKGIDVRLQHGPVAGLEMRFMPVANSID